MRRAQLPSRVDSPACTAQPFAVEQMRASLFRRDARAAKPIDRLAHWRDNVSRDPWIEESVNVLGDMAGK